MEKIKKTLRDTEDKLNKQQQCTPKTTLRMRKKIEGKEVIFKKTNN